jgi:hypothetical protein
LRSGGFLKMHPGALGRFELNSITAHRVLAAAFRRLVDIPDSAAWYLGDPGEQNREKVRAFQDIHRGQRCFIVANGHSLAQTNLELLQNEISFGTNRIYLHFNTSRFRPTYYLAVDEELIPRAASEIRLLQMPKFINWSCRRLFDPDESGTAFLKSRLVLRDSFETDMTRPIVMGATVTFVALQLAYYMGFRRVVFVGLDHNYVNAETQRTDARRSPAEDPFHFHPGYVLPGRIWSQDMLRSEIDYHLARQAFEADGREIRDATIGGRCPVFQRVEYSSLF